MLGLINVSGELQVILDENQENPNVVNRNTPKISFNLQSTKDKPAKNDSEILDSLSKNHSSESHSKSRRFHSRPTPYAFDNNSRKSDKIIQH